MATSYFSLDQILHSHFVFKARFKFAAIILSNLVKLFFWILKTAFLVLFILRMRKKPKFKYRY